MSLKIDENNLKEGLLGLVIALLEIIIDALEIQALNRMENNSLTETEINRLGNSLLELNQAIKDIKTEHSIEDAVKSVKDGLDDLADEVVDRFINPEKWEDDIDE